MTLDEASLLWFLIYSSEYGLVRGIPDLKKPFVVLCRIYLLSAGDGNHPINQKIPMLVID
jgi:hypothetical protein